MKIEKQIQLDIKFSFEEQEYCVLVMAEALEAYAKDLRLEAARGPIVAMETELKYGEVELCVWVIR